ncbi:hypothetical protein D9Q98_002691 [Chlorella vulgaris]|uniref:Uncharacterized protein n=1 Tax=Chlorella vulgaris TaxID=3077 RepID=A0A9D4TU93_CHLVU|nr:hypothetical protein D9Q98_002691 [Chlorella vulgaris]
MDSSPSSVIGSEEPALDAASETAGSGASSAGATEPAHATLAIELPAPSECSAQTTASSPPADEGLAELRVLGRQLLLGWAEALGTLVKLQGVGSMRVDALAARLQQLALEASPVSAAAATAAAAASRGGGEGSTAAAPAAGAAPAAEAGALPGSSRGASPPPASGTELAGPACQPHQAYSDPVDMFATAAKSAHLSYPELLHAFAASAEGLDDEALVDYLFNLAMLCAEPPENELVVRPVLSLPQNSEEQQQYRRRQAAGSSTPVDAMLAAMQQQQQQQQQQHQGGPSAVRSGGGGGLTHEAIWQQIVSQQHQPQAGGASQYGRLPPSGGRSGGLHQGPGRSKSDMLSSYQQALADPQMQGLLRSMAQQHQQHAPQMPAHHQYQHQQLPQYGTASLAASTSPTRGLQSSGSPIAKAVSMPERDLWLAAASLATEAEQKHHEAAAAAAAASASFSFRPPQPPTPAFGRLPLPALGGGGGSSASGGSGGLWSSTGGSGSGGAMLRSVSDLPY